MNPHTDRTEARSYAPYHGVMQFRRLPSALGYRLAACTGAGLALIVILLEQLL